MLLSNEKQLIIFAEHAIMYCSAHDIVLVSEHKNYVYFQENPQKYCNQSCSFWLKCAPKVFVVAAIGTPPGGRLSRCELTR